MLLDIALPMAFMPRVDSNLIRAVCSTDTFDDLARMAVSPTHARTKGAIPLFGAWAYLGMDDDWYDHSVQRSTRIAYTSALVLDYDGGETSMLDVTSVLRSPFIAYATSSNRSKLVTKFRVVLPLASEVPIDAFSMPANRANLLKAYPSVDVTTFDVGRFFFAPAVLEGTVYRSVVSTTGELIDPNDLISMDIGGWEYKPDADEVVSNLITSEVGKLISVKSRQSCLLDTKTEMTAEDAMQWVEEKLSTVDFNVRGTGVVHKTLRDCTYLLYKLDVDEEDVSAFMSDCVDYYKYPSLRTEVKGLIDNLYTNA